MMSIWSRFTFVLCLLLLSSVSHATVPQGSGAESPQDEEPLPKAQLDTTATKKFQKLFDDAMPFVSLATLKAKQRMKVYGAMKTMKEQIASYEKKEGVGSILADSDAWRKIFDANLQSRLQKGEFKKPSGRGRIKTDTIRFERGGELMLFEYAYRLPKNYSVKKRWPVVLCLHDEECKSGERYLKKVWAATKADSKICDSVILVAPTLQLKTVKGKVKGRRVSQVSMEEWFGRIHAMAILRPIAQVRKRFNCDPERFYVEGVGRGGQMALDLAALYGGMSGIAAVVARQAQPRDLALLPGMGSFPTLFLYREAGPMEQAQTNPLWEDIGKIAEREKITSFEFVKKPKLESVTRKTMCEQKNEPLQECNQEVLDFLSQHKVQPYPEKVRFVTNRRLFSRSSWIKLNGLEVSEGGVVDCEAIVDKKTNAVRLTGQGFAGFTLYLNDEIIDMDRPVEVYVNGQIAARKQLERSLSYMLDGMKKGSTATLRIATNYLTGEVPEKKTEGGDNPEDDIK